MVGEKRIPVTKPLLRNEKVETIHGTMTAKEWLASEKKRIAEANRKRYPKVESVEKGTVLTASEPPPREEPKW